MFKTTPTQSAENLLLDMAENAEVDSGTSSTTRSTKNLSASVDMGEDVEVGEGDDGDNETVKKSPFFKKRNGPMGYLTPLCFNADNALFAKRQVSPDSLWPLLKLSVKDIIGKAIKQSSCWATQSFNSNRSANFFEPNYV